MDKHQNIKPFVSELDDDCLEIFYKPGADIPKISIVIPSFNQGRFLERTILSILNQNYPAIELIIIDGGSTDETLTIIQKYKKFIFYWISEPDNGQSDALNKGFAQATGDIFGWQNSDDVYLPGTFQKISGIFMSNKTVSVCYGNWYAINIEDQVIDSHYALKPRKPKAPFENMDVYNQTLFWKAEAHKRFGSFDSKLFQLMDNDLMIRLLLNEGPENFFKVDDFLGAFRVHDDQKTDMKESGNQYFDDEVYLEQKFGFKSAKSVSGKYDRFCYRLAQLFESLASGGLLYTVRKFLITYRRRGKFF